VRFTLFARTQILVSALPNTAKAKYYTHSWRLCACALRQLRHRGKVHFHNSEERFYWKIIVAESGVGGGRRRVLVAQTAYMYWPAGQLLFPAAQSLTHARSTYKYTHNRERERERKVGSARFLSTRHSLFSVRMLVKNRKNAGRITSQSGGCGSRDAAPLFTFYTAFQLCYYMYVHMSLSAMCRRGLR
jgi:hypothetical protein